MIVKRRLNHGTCFRSRRCVGWIEEIALVAELAGRESEHLAKLPGTDNANAHACG
jgi:hypothetical protein